VSKTCVPNPVTHILKKLKQSGEKRLKKADNRLNLRWRCA
jgi:hypothetical protein